MELTTGPLSSAINLTEQTVGSTLALEHALIMLLLLVGLLKLRDLADDIFFHNAAKVTLMM